MTQAKLHDSGKYSFSNCNFSNLEIVGHGAAIVCTSSHSTINIVSCSFTSCTSSLNGGAVFSDGKWNSLTVADCLFKDCLTTSTTSYPGGGGICVEGSSASLTIHTTSFIECKASVTNRGGSGFFASQMHSSYTYSSRFISCLTNCAGGAIFFYEVSNAISISDTLFSDNSAASHGGAIREHSNTIPSTPHISYSFFTGNTAQNKHGNDFCVYPEITSTPFTLSLSTGDSNRVAWATGDQAHVYEDEDIWLPQGIVT